jgi:anaerobic magnesium-protoporphyrin IX monomethyl ester cyclase
MDVLLTRLWNHTSMLIPNHGLGYLASSLKKSGHNATIVDCIRDSIGIDAFWEMVAAGKFQIIGFQVYTFDLEILSKTLGAARKDGCIFIAGGPHPSADPMGFLNQFPLMDFCLSGEAEKTLPQLIAILNHSPTLDMLEFAGVPGLFYRTGREIAGSPPEFETDLDSLGFPDWSQISPLSYPVAPQGTFTRRLPFAPIIVTRGCPYPCTFCAGKLVSGRKIRSRTVDHVISELKFLVQSYGIREFHVQDDNFTHNKEFVLEFCTALLRSGLDLAWSCPNGIRLVSLDEEMVSAMEEAGCYSVAVGIESGSQRILDLMKKKVHLQEIITKINLIRRVTNWHITGFFILGYPGETLSEMKTTIKFSRQLPIDKANYGILMPLPGTEAAEEAKQTGWDPGKNSYRMSEYRSSFTPSGVSQMQFRWLLIQAFIGFYARPRIIWRFFRQIQSMDQVKILFRRLKDVLTP